MPKGGSQGSSSKGEGGRTPARVKRRSALATKRHPPMRSMGRALAQPPVRLWAAYLSHLEARPRATKLCTSAAAALLGDALAQHLAGRRRRLSSGGSTGRLLGDRRDRRRDEWE